MMARFELVKPGAHAPLDPSVLAQRDVPPRLHDLRAGAPLYQVDEALATAVNVALTIGAPLLVTGDPGTGKTQLAYYLAWYFGIEKDVAEDEREQPFTLTIKSTTVARDLLYQFDTVAYFREARVAEQDEAVDKRKHLRKGPLWRALDLANEGKPAIVLLDEIDKAPRDFPNDLLHELDQFSFEVKETDETIRRPRDVPPPIVVVTSNSEKSLPPAFLRRCVFHHIEFDDGLVRKAISAWRKAQGGPEAGAHQGSGAPELHPRDEAAVRSFMRVREVGELDKVPATAELLGWLAALDARGTEVAELGEGVRLRDLPLLSALVKDREDFERIRER